MSDEPRGVLIGTFPSGLGAVASFGEDVGGKLAAEAAAKLDAARDAREAEKAEADARARATVTVDRQWLLDVLRDLIFSMESHRKLADRRGDYARGRELLRKGWERRESYDSIAKEPPP
jgi:hypothetical protein